MDSLGDGPAVTFLINNVELEVQDVLHPPGGVEAPVSVNQLHLLHMQGGHVLFVQLLNGCVDDLRYIQFINTA